MTDTSRPTLTAAGDTESGQPSSVVGRPERDVATASAPRLRGATNFRSLALTARDGRSLRAHMLMRSDRLHGLTSDDWATLRGTVNFAMEFPELAKRLMPVLLPWFDRAA